MRADSIADTLGVFLSPDDIVELRFLRTGRGDRSQTKALCVRLRNLGQRFAERIAAEDADPSCGGVYFAPQILSVVRYKRAAGWSEWARRNELARDDDVTARRYLIIDVDPVRAEGHAGRSATDDEKAGAAAVLANVRRFLASAGWRPPVVVDSGNGFHAYYKLPAPLPGGPLGTNDPARELLRRLASVFDTEGAKVDTAVCNSARVMKLPGTWARKGADTTDRPHRISKILEIPNGWRD